MTNKHGFCRIRSLLLVLAMILSVSVWVSAEETTVYAVSYDGKEEYTSISDAWAAAQNSDGIFMTSDWVLGGMLTLGEGKTATIYMNGHSIDRKLDDAVSDGGCFYLKEGASLTLSGRDRDLFLTERMFSYYKYTDYYKYEDNRTVCSITSGGLVTGGCTSKSGGAVYLEENGSLVLEHVALAGNRCFGSFGGLGGAVYLSDDNCTLIMQEGARLEGNFAYQGGGVYMYGEKDRIEMRDASVMTENSSWHGGGSVFVDNVDCTIVMEGKSSITNSRSNWGGGVYFNYTRFSLTSPDASAVISGNTAHEYAEGDGGGVGMDSDAKRSNSGVISGITFQNNTAGRYGGGVYSYQENVKITNCTFTGNSAREGGGIYIDNDLNTISDCTVTGNSAEETGGGIYSSSYNDYAMEGKMTVTGNFRQSDKSADNVYLNDATCTSYLTGAPAEGSQVGIRTDASSSNRKIGEDAVFDPRVFSSDVDGWHIEYRENDRELWLVKGSKYYVTVNGVTQGAYAAGQTVTINGTSTDSSRVFKTWNVSEDVTFANAGNAVTTFTMPAYNVSVSATYVTKIKEATLKVAEPTAGKYFPQAGSLSWDDGSDGIQVPVNVRLFWLAQVDDTTQTVSGKAQYATQYSVAAQVGASLQGEQLFADDIVVWVQYGSREAQKAYKAHVDESGNLQIIGRPIETAKPKITAVTGVSMTVDADTTRDALTDLLPAAATVQAQDGASYTVATDLKNADFTDAFSDGKICNGGTVKLPLALTEEDPVTNNAEIPQTLTVTLNVTEETVTAAPQAETEPGTYQAKTVTVKLSCTETANISYTVNDAETQMYSEETGILLEGTAGEKKTFRIKAQAQAEGKSASSEVVFVYVLDNPFTVTIYGRDTGTAGDNLWAEPKTYHYHSGDKVVIAAPSVEGECFEKWESVPEYAAGNETDLSLLVSPITQDVTVRAIYNPVVTELALTLDAPATGTALADKITEAEATATTAAEATQYFSSIEWSPADKTAAGSTAYTARLTMTGDSTTKYVLSDSLKISVNGDDSILAAVVQENGSNVLYLTFPATEAAKLTSVVQPDSVEIPYEFAASGKWGLPGQTDLILSDGSRVAASITWNTLPTLDRTSLSAQTLTAVGTVQLPETVGASDVSTEIRLTVQVQAAEQVSTPEASVDYGIYADGQQIFLSCDTKDVEFYYTLDGSTPTTESTHYDGTAIQITEADSPVTLRILAVRDAMLPSEVAVYTYDIRNVYDTNQDGVVDLRDITHIQRSYGLSEGDAGWDALMDVDNSRRIDLKDFVLILNHFTKEE